MYDKILWTDNIGHLESKKSNQILSFFKSTGAVCPRLMWASTGSKTQFLSTESFKNSDLTVAVKKARQRRGVAGGWGAAVGGPHRYGPVDSLYGRPRRVFQTPSRNSYARRITKWSVERLRWRLLKRYLQLRSRRTPACSSIQFSPLAVNVTSGKHFIRQRSYRRPIKMANTEVSLTLSLKKPDHQHPHVILTPTWTLNQTLSCQTLNAVLCLLVKCVVANMEVALYTHCCPSVSAAH